MRFRGIVVMNTPHKHAEVIKKWADGAKIQYRAGATDRWIDTNAPPWSPYFEYRVKPEPKVVKLYLYEYQGSFLSEVDQPPTDAGCWPGDRRWKHVNTFEHIEKE